MVVMVAIRCIWLQWLPYNFQSGTVYLVAMVAFMA